MSHESLAKHESQEVSFDYRREETDYDTIGAIERDELLQNPEYIGFNLTGDQFISPARLKMIAEAQRLVDAIGEEEAFKQLSKQYEQPVEQVQQVFDSSITTEMAKVDQLQEMLESVPDGASFRVHPYAPESPFSMENCRHVHDGVEFFSFDPIALEQMRAIYDKCNAGEQPGNFTVVMNPYTAERGGNIPTTDAEIDDYSKMCISFLDQMQLREAGGAGICLELGNETNVGLDTRGEDGSPMFDKAGFANTVDAQAYAKMYARVAKAIKAEFPQVELAIAGVAMFDDSYLEDVITNVTEQNGGETGLIDKISFHPYRSTVSEGSATFDVASGTKQCVASELSYDEQCARMAELVQLAGAKRYDVGEVAFINWGADGRTINTEELHANSADAKSKGLKNYIWPSDQIIQYG